jgi:hypothetical protein
MTMNRREKNFLSDYFCCCFRKLHAALTEYIGFEGHLAHYVKIDIGDIYRRFTKQINHLREREEESRIRNNSE